MIAPECDQDMVQRAIQAYFMEPARVSQVQRRIVAKNDLDKG